MSIRIADARLLANVPVSRVTLLGSLEGWSDALRAVGIDVVDSGADLVVAESSFARRAARLDAPVVIVLGARRGVLRRAGYSSRTLVVRPGRAGIRLFVPVDDSRAAEHALLLRIPGRSWIKRVAARAALVALRAGMPLRAAITIGTRGADPPRILAEASTLGTGPPTEWYLLAGDGDDLQRLVWFCFDGDSRSPAWAVKCSRVPGNDESFRREAAALVALDRLPPARRHAPRLLGRLEVDGLPIAVETAGVGQPLQLLLPHARANGLEIVNAIADWVVELGRATARPAADLRPELRRLDDEVVPLWAGAPPGLAASLPAVAAVLQHNDLGCWNILVEDSTFTVLDWESSRPSGLPLWDLVYFLTDALSGLTAPEDNQEKERRMLELLRGELVTSGLLFGRLAAAAAAFGVPANAVGPIVTLGWLHHGLSADARARRGSRQGATTGAPSSAGPLQQIADSWLSDPALGVAWTAFARAGRSE
jgi:hypothetical protein